MIGRIRRALALYREVHRRWQRYRLARPAGSSVHQGALETAMLEGIYELTAARYGLTTRRLGQVLSIESGTRRFRVRGEWSEFDTIPVGMICGDKVLVRDLLQAQGLLVPEGAAFPTTAARQAWDFARTLPGTSVVKPARDTSGARGVTVDVRDERTFRRAFRVAAILSNEILIERFIPGDNYRVLVYKGRCISIVLRELPAVTGDGRSSVAELVRAENARRISTEAWRAGDPLVMPFKWGTDLVDTLRKQGLTPTGVPASGQRVILSQICNLRLGATGLEYPQLHPEIVRASERAADLIGVTLAGVDVIVPDGTRPEYWINEVNTTPGMHGHYAVRNPESMGDPIGKIVADVFGLEYVPWVPPVR